ncbi:hypothetical protein [Corallococcus sp. CA049B]|uniref:hypothetical protein n=1 Tax=Corallococcus sp. CA049B TaxID=2316730 RepID=UPI000EA0BB79|nr:hypothetical protein [Corallococcus sp. CA049B]
MVKTWRRGLLGAMLLTAAGASAEPPPSNSAQGTQLHGTGRFESINIPLATVEEPSPPTAGCRPDNLYAGKAPWEYRVTASLAGVFATSTQAPAGFVHVRDLGYLPAVGQLPGRDL